MFFIIFTFRAEAVERPNIILVFIDDMGWSDFSCFGNKDAQTPHIDALAEEGIAFEQFYVNSPICSPSRVAISTGTYPQRWGISSYLAYRKDNKRRGMENWLDPNAPMLVRELRESSYMTGHFGKWHMGGQRDVTDAPIITDYGFDEYLTNFEGIGNKLLPLTKRPDGQVKKIWQQAEVLGAPVKWVQRYELTSAFVDASIEFIKKAKIANKPFYINLWPDDVHEPFWPPVDKWGDGSKRTLYLSVLESMDKQLGVLFDFIKMDENLKNNTMILICSDNGPDKGAGEAGPFKGLKALLYEGGLRSPLIVWGPGLIEEKLRGKRNKNSVFSAIDLVPSLAKIAGVASKGLCDGEDLSKVLLGKSESSRQKPLFFSRPPDRKNFKGWKNLPDLAIREGRWKLLCDYDGSRPELHDLNLDPGEKHNLAKTKPELVEKLTKQVQTWYSEVSK